MEITACIAFLSFDKQEKIFLFQAVIKKVFDKK